MIHGTNSVCRVWLNPTSRDLFQQTLRTCLEEFLIIKDENNQQSSSSTTKGILDELSNHENEPFYRNDEPFDCIICMNSIGKGDGILFHNCLHPFCKPCLIQMIQTSTDPTLKCPHDDCGMILEERELRGVRTVFKTKF